MTSQTADSEKKPSKVEEIKVASRNLRGTLLEGLADESTGAISADDTQISKFHGLYQQDDRDLRAERRKAKMERAYSFMMRIRAVGGVVSPGQYLTVDRLADEYANGTIRLTTRQAFQLHGILKGSLKPTIQGLYEAGMDTISACGDVNRNVMCHPLPQASSLHEEVHAVAQRISDHLTPKSRAYFEIWLDEEKVAEVREEEEPIYGKTYLPRKFKIGMALPPSNDVDVFSQDLGFIAIVEDGKLAGFNVVAGGGMGMTHGKANTYPLLAQPIGFCTPDQAVAVAEAVVTTQRDFGDRSDRKHARLKYTIEDRGLEWFIGEVNNRLGWNLEQSRPYSFDTYGEDYGWSRDATGKWYYNSFILSGRIKDADGLNWKSAFREIAGIHDGDFRLTPNQNLMITGVTDAKKPEIEEILRKHGLADALQQSALRLNAMSCPALPTCGLALAESERIFPEVLEALEEEIEKAGLRDDAISIRMTGCPNGCARPYLAEIGLVGKAPGKYNLYLGARHDGTRLNKEVMANVTLDEIYAKLRPIIRDYAREREEGERFGDFCVRRNVTEAEGVPA